MAASLSLIKGIQPMINHPVSYLIQAVSGAGVYLIAQDGLPNNWIALIERVGLAIVLVGFFVWTGWQREKRMGKRIDYLEKQNVAVIGKLAGLTGLVTETIRLNTETVSSMTRLIESRPCVAFQTFDEFNEWKRIHVKG